MSTFTLDTIHSFDRMKAFLSAEREVEEILRSAESDEPNNLAGFWNVTRLVITTPLALILALFLYCISLILSSVQASSLSIQCEILSKHALSGLIELTAVIGYGSKMIAPLYNMYALSASDVYLQPPLTLPSPSLDERMQQVVKDQREIRFYSPEGVCKGLNTWFWHLYSQTKDRISGTDRCLRCVAKSFYPGAQSQPSSLHALYYPEKNLLGMNRPDVDQSPSHPPSAPLTDRSNLTRVIGSLEPGVYEIWFHFHRMGYLKEGPELGYLVDFNSGVIKFEGSGMPSQVSRYLDYYNKPELLNGNRATFIRNLFSS
ncbi:MAG: hypothetical protein HYX48_04915 [Chlamydiales bacterium]|nr:hypothetical protein [Chlamydiales bacterium]